MERRTFEVESWCGKSEEVRSQPLGLIWPSNSVACSGRESNVQVWSRSGGDGCEVWCTWSLQQQRPPRQVLSFQPGELSFFCLLEHHMPVCCQVCSILSTSAPRWLMLNLAFLLWEMLGLPHLPSLAKSISVDFCCLYLKILTYAF